MAKKAQTPSTPQQPINYTIMKRFVIRKSLVGKGAIIKFTNKKGEECIYDHDKVYTQLQEKFDNMECFKKYKTYTNTNNLPKFVRDLKEIV